MSAGKLVTHELKVNDTTYPHLDLEYEEPGLYVSDIPDFSATIPNKQGIYKDVCAQGDEVTIYRNNSLVFRGIIEGRKSIKSSDGIVLEISGRHKGYLYLLRQVCDNYAAEETSVQVNPWQYGRKLNEATEDLMDGLRPDEILKCLIGTKFIWQEYFDNFLYALRNHTGCGIYEEASDGEITRYLRGAATQTATEGGAIGDFRLWEGYVDPYDVILHFVPTTFMGESKNGVFESIELINGDKAQYPMGDIASVEVYMRGYKSGDCSQPRLFVCRDATEETRTYHEVTLVHDNGVDPEKWTGSYTFSDSPTIKNEFAYKIWINGSDTGTSDSSNLIEYAKFTCTTASDTGITEGTIDVYDDPATMEMFVDDVVAVDTFGLTRLQAIENVRKVTVADDSYADPNWDCWIDNDLQLHFTQHRGNTEQPIPSYSFAERNVTELASESDIMHLANIITAYGAGAPPYQTTRTGTGLKNQTSIDTYGVSHGFFKDTSISNVATLFKRAKAYLKYISVPHDDHEIRIVNDFDWAFNVGDMISITDADLNMSGQYRVIKCKRSQSWDSDETIDVALGTIVSTTAGKLFCGIQDAVQNQVNVYGGTKDLALTTANALVFDRTRHAAYQFRITDPDLVDEVSLYVRTEPFVAFAKTAVATIGASTTSSAGGGGVAVGDTTSSVEPAVTGTTNNIPDRDYLFSWDESGNNKTVAHNTWTSLYARTPTGFATGGCGVMVWIKTDNDVDAIHVRVNQESGTNYHPDQLGIKISGDIANSSGNVNSFYIPVWQNVSGKNLDIQVYIDWTDASSHAIDWGTSMATWASHYFSAASMVAANHPHIVSDLVLYYTGEGYTHTHTVSASEHSHDLEFGIYQLEDDGGNAVYPVGIVCRVQAPGDDPGEAMESIWIDEVGQFGAEGSSVERHGIDITDALRDPTTGKLKKGIYTLYFKSEFGSTKNPKGLGRVFVTHYVHQMNAGMAQ